MSKNRMFYVVVTSFAISGSSLGLVPFAIGKDGNLNLLGYVSGALFWIGLIIGISSYILLYRRLKAKIQTVLPKEERLYALHFFSNQMAMIADSIMIAALIGVVVCGVNTSIPMYLPLACIVLLLLGVYGHFLFNGKVYQYICITKDMS